jgi:soluble lytic murein transglycosylase-like protein
MDEAARADGVALSITSAYRSDAEQAVLWNRNPDPRMVARPGTSLHRNGTELDLGPPAAYAWLAANAGRFHFLKRYSWEPWHFGYTLNPSSSPRRAEGDGAAGVSHGAVPGFVPARYAPMLRSAAQRWNVSATLLAAQIYAESNFNPFARSPAGAEGIAQFMPGTAEAMGLADPFDAAAAIDAQAHLMRDLLGRFGSVPLALAAYNAGPGAVAACGCIPPYPETTAYVARILGLLAGAGGSPTPALTVRLVGWAVRPSAARSACSPGTPSRTCPPGSAPRARSRPGRSRRAPAAAAPAPTARRRAARCQRTRGPSRDRRGCG